MAETRMLCRNCGRDIADRKLTGMHFDSSLPAGPAGDKETVWGRCDICYSAALIANQGGLEKFNEWASQGDDVRLALVTVYDGMVGKVVATDLWPWLRKGLASDS